MDLIKPARNLFSPPLHLQNDPFLFRKARVLIFVHVFLLVVTIVLSVVSLIFTPENNFPAIPSILGLTVLFLVFKRFGNFVLSGNILTLLWFVLLAPKVLETGGIVSDNLLWLFLSPLFAMLFANKISVYIWAIIVIGFSCFLFYMDIKTNGKMREVFYQFEGSYIFISYTSLFLILFTVVSIFKASQDQAIAALKEQSAILSSQKLEIEKKSQEIILTKEKFEASNLQLEQFAYVASHDLKEPLRMINIYTQLIKKRLDQQLEGSTAEYMDFVTDGVKRMQQMLDDLLEYSRLGRNHDKDKTTDLNNILFLVMNNMMVKMKETDTVIYANDLPSLKTSSTEMIQLFQNFVSNAIKFKREEINPEIHIYVDDQGQEYVFTVMDNGIGIADEHQNRIFNIFERLHSKAKYEGSGIGLATCKKIVENFGGKIWLDSKEGEGSIFYFSIPKSFAA
ncbi:MAG: GHKL domain-containing protein [Bacteroidetes bacterium]|nr:GHKL domain-containing protein [Bacteroidota bacterium]